MKDTSGLPLKKNELEDEKNRVEQDNRTEKGKGKDEEEEMSVNVKDISGLPSKNN